MKDKTLLIIGTNAVGKSTLARKLISLAGGIKSVNEGITYCNDGKTAAIGDYQQGKNIEGVDSLGKTTVLAGMIKNADCKNIIFEGLKCGTFGVAIQTALFEGRKQLIVFLYASAKTIDERLKKRSGTGIKTVSVLKQQKVNLSAAMKYGEIGVPVLIYNTDEYDTQTIAEEVYSKFMNL